MNNSSISNMKNRKSTLSDVLTSHFLFFSWIDLRNNKNIFSSFSSYKTSLPISKYWFEKTSALIRSGKASYNADRKIRLSKYNFKKKFLINLKAKIIENSFVLLLEPYFFCNHINNRALTKCVR